LLVKQACHSAAEMTAEPDVKETQGTNIRQWNLCKIQNIAIDIHCATTIFRCIFGYNSVSDNDPL